MGAIGEPDLELAAFAGTRDGEARVAEDAEHRGVLGQHLRDELRDAGLRRSGREPLKEASADPAPLEIVADCEGDLRRPRVPEPDPVRDRDDAAIQRSDECTTLLPVGSEHGVDERRAERWEAVEAEVAALVRKAREELDERVGILRGGRPQP